MNPQEPNFPLAFVRARIAAAPRLEFEQASLRFVLAGIVLMYVAWYVLRHAVTADAGEQGLLVTLAFFIFAGLAAAGIVFAPSSAKAFRIAGIVADNAITTYAICVLGEGGAVLLGAYLFIALGNGFRYGSRYLYTSQMMAIVGLLFALVISPFWSSHLWVGLGFLIALIIVPFYVGMLAGRIEVARRRAEDALRAQQK